MKRQSSISSLLWLLLGSYVAIHAYRMGLGHLHEPGPGFIFFLAALLVVILAVVDMAMSLTANSQTITGTAGHQVWAGVQWRRILVVMGGIAAYVYIFDVLGFVASTFLLMLLLFKGVESSAWWKTIISSVITTTSAYLIFKVWLGVPFPGGILGL